MAKRNNGEGTIYRRPDDHWAARLSVNRRRKYVCGRTRQEAAEKLR